MKNWSDSVLSPNSPIREAVRTVDATKNGLALVMREGKLLGTVSDIDVRRALLAGFSLDDQVARIMNSAPVVAGAGQPVTEVLALGRELGVGAVPRLDDTGRVQDVLVIPPGAGGRDNWVILMAGGPGQRLRPLTENCPKPLLKVRGKPLLELTLENLIAFGFRRFFLAVNYKASMVKDYFGDGSQWGVEISYLEERERLGTAGAVGLLEERPSVPLLVMNGDVLTRVNFDQLLAFHERVESIATMSVRMYQYQIPYGLVDVGDVRIRQLREKPIQSFFVNAGIYLLNPVVIERIEKGVPLDMPTLFERLIAEGANVCAFPIRERWIDIGDLAEYQRAQEDSDGEGFVSPITATSAALA